MLCNAIHKLEGYLYSNKSFTYFTEVLSFTKQFKLPFLPPKTQQTLRSMADVAVDLKEGLAPAVKVGAIIICIKSSSGCFSLGRGSEAG